MLTHPSLTDRRDSMDHPFAGRWTKPRQPYLEHKPPLHRPARGLSYLTLAMAGACVFFIYLPFMDPVERSTILSIGVFLVLGGLVSGAGHLFRILSLEVAGFPLLVTASGGLAVMLFVGSGTVAARAFMGLFILSFTLNLIARGVDLYTLRRFSLAALEVIPRHDA